jgi:heme exporter protein A
MTDATSLKRAPAAGGMTAANGAVELRGLWRAFGDRVVLGDVSIRVSTGETLAVLGPNGAGKTTLLRVLATLLRPTRGAAAVLGCDLPKEAWRARGRIGFVGHEPLLYRDLTGAENLRFCARLYGLGEEAASARIAELLDRVRMSRRAGELVRNLSAGMVQRLAVCRALLHEPELLLLDEPRSHLDPEAAGLVEPLLGPAPGRTRVIVTHDVDAGLAAADAVLALRADGSVAYAGEPSGLSAGDARAIYGGAP